MSPPSTLAAASFKDMQTRTLSLNRPSIAPTGLSPFPSRQSHPHGHSRNISHSITIGPTHNPAHRISRRKSINSPTVNHEAVVASLKEAGSLPLNAVLPRGRAVSKTSRSGSPPSNSNTQMPKASPDVKEAILAASLSAVENEHLSGDESSAAFQKARVRRASDGQPLAKDGRKSNRVELRCDQCGKGYKHSSCLTKHLWEHTPQWSYTSKLLISKHQQVQLLEAASVLVAMNSTTPPDSTKNFMGSDRESVSPAASGYSDQQGGQSSANTTPPPHVELFGSTHRSMVSSPVTKGSSSGSGLTQSLRQQASTGNGNMAASAPNGSSEFGNFRRSSVDQRPPSSGMNKTGRDDRDLAATLQMLTCNVGSDPSRTFGFPTHLPRVPSLQAQYLDEVALGTSFMTMGSIPTQPESFARGEHVPEDAKMEGSSNSVIDEDEFDLRSRARSDEDDDGVFGRMEE